MVSLHHKRCTYIGMVVCRDRHDLHVPFHVCCVADRTADGQAEELRHVVSVILPTTALVARTLLRCRQSVLSGSPPSAYL